jgi:lysophospholipase L1-like esterase
VELGLVVTRTLMNEKHHFLFLGDSYTAGTAVAPEQRWPDQLVSRYRSVGWDVADAHIIAGNGWTTTDLRAALAQQDPAPGYRLVFLLIGVNNQYFGRAFPEFREDYEFLLRRSIALAAQGSATNVYGVSIPDYSVTPFVADPDRGRIRDEIERYNAACREICAQLDVGFLDTVDISRRAGQERNLLVEDGLHPSADMYRLWSDAIFDRIRPAAGA